MSSLSAVLSKAWTITPNLRNTFVSLADSTAFLLYQNKVAMKLVGWTVKFSCDGTTGPSSPSDTTDRWSTQAAAQTRASVAAAAQSWIVLQNADGLQVMFDFQGATDDISRISYSPGGLFTLASPSTNQPTATDEVIASTGNSLVNSGTSGDRVLTIWCSNDTKQWSHLIARAGSVIHCMGIERVTSYCGTGVFTVPYFTYRYTAFNRPVNPPGSGVTPTNGVIATVPGTAGYVGAFARVFTAAAFRLTRLGGGFINICSFPDGFTRTFNDLSFLADRPGLQGGLTTPLSPFFLTGEKTANNDGILGSPIDWWLAYTSNCPAVPAFGTFMPGYEPGDNPLTDPERSAWIVCLGASMIRPWRNASAVLRIY